MGGEKSPRQNNCTRSINLHWKKIKIKKIIIYNLFGDDQ